MYIGIYINDSHISSAAMNYLDEAELIMDNTSSKKGQFLTPLKIYIEDNYAYTGDQVDFLVANEPTLKVGRNFMNKLSPRETVYTDKTGVHWNAQSLLSVFLRKLKLDLQVYSDILITGVMVTTSLPITTQAIEAFKMAFKTAEMPLCGVIDIGKTTILGYRLFTNSKKASLVTCINLDPYQLTINMQRIDKDQYRDILLYKNSNALGANELYQRLSDFLIQQYERYTNQEIKKTARNETYIYELVKKIMIKYVSGPALYISIVCGFDDTVIELILVKQRITKILTKFISEVYDFMTEELKKNKTSLNKCDEILLSGSSVLLPFIKVHLENTLKSEKTSIQINEPEQVITKGAALYANDTIERAISNSLIIDIIHEEEPEEYNIENDDPEDVPDQQLLDGLIKKIRINAGCDV